MRSAYCASLAVFLCFLFMPAILFAEVVSLKSGQKVEGPILEKTDQFIKINFGGTPVTYYMDEISSVETSAGTSVSEQVKSQNELFKEPALPFKTAIITYKLEGYTKGQEIVYIDAVNNRIAKDTSSKIAMGSFEINDHKLTILDKGVMSIVDLNRNTAATTEIKTGITSIFNEQMLYGQPVEKATFLGKECKMYELNGGRQYFWYGILLKSEITKSPMGEEYNSSQEATDIQVDVDIPPEKFAVPAGVEIKDPFKEIANQMQQMHKVMDESAGRIKNELAEQAKTDPQAAKQLQDIVSADGKVDAMKYVNMLNAKANVSLVKAHLRSLSIAAETFFTDNKGVYPEKSADLLSVTSAELAKDYCGIEEAGFKYTCELSAKGYTFTATTVDLSGGAASKITVSTGGEMKEEGL